MALPFHHTDPNAHKQLFENIASRTSGYELCEFYFFRHPVLRPGFQPAQGGLLENAATLYPEAWAYLHTAEGQMLCATETEWQAMTTATWATLADGTRVGWNGIGGAPFYAPDAETGALRLPDLRGMYAEAAGYDGLDAGGVHGDVMRNITGMFVCNTVGSYGAANGAFTMTTSWYSAGPAGTTSPAQHAGQVGFNISRVVPIGSANKPRAYGVLPCVYLGAPR